VVPEELFYILPNGTAVVFAGLLPRLLKQLGTRNIQYEIVDKRAPLPEPDYSMLLPLREGQDRALAAVISSYGGIINTPTAHGKTFMLTMLARIYPNQKILVSVGASLIKELHERVVEAVPHRKVSIIRAGKNFKPDSDIIVCSSKCLHKMDPEWPDMVLFDEVHEAAGPQVCERLAEFCLSCRMFGFSASPWGRSDGADLVTEALFGQVICHITYQEAQAAGSISPIKVHMVPVNLPDMTYATTYQRNRYGIWENMGRNQIIAETARKYPDEQVLILVSTIEHALNLRMFLPEYTLVYATFPKEERRVADLLRAGLTTEEEVTRKLDKDQMKADFRDRKLMKVIATMVWKQGVDFPHLEWLIRADATSSDIFGTQIPGRLSRLGDDCKTHGNLVDFTDEFGDAFEKRSKTRVRQYKKKGWEIINVSDK
jgi:superfamily II DNA or RNA helicase